FRSFHWHEVELDRDAFVVAADHQELHDLTGVEVSFLMRHVWGEVNAIAGPDLGREFEPLSPAYFAAAFDDVHGHLVAAMVMRTGVHTGRERHRPDPGLLSSRAREVERGGAAFLRRFAHGRPERLGAHDRDAVSPPSPRFRHRGPSLATITPSADAR